MNAYEFLMAIQEQFSEYEREGLAYKFAEHHELSDQQMADLLYLCDRVVRGVS